jgi:hypothetical protein
LLGLLVVFTPVDMGIGFAGGEKTSTMLPLLYVLAAYCIVRRRVPIGPIVVATIFFFLFVVPANLSYRQGVRVQDVAPQFAPREVLSTSPKFDPATPSRTLLDYVSVRF